MYKVEYLPTARQDMIDIVLYISGALGNPIAADHLAEKLVAAAEGLADNPYTYPAYHPIRALKYDYRKTLVDNYIIFFHVNEETKCVTIARVIYGRRNYSTLLD